MIEDNTPSAAQTPSTAPPAEKAAAPKSHALLSPLIVEVGAGVSSAAVAGATVWVNTEQHAYKNISALHAFEGMKKTRQGRFVSEVGHNVKVGAAAKNAAYDAAEGIVHWNQKEGYKIMREVVGADTFLKRWGLLRMHQKIETLIFAGAAAALGLGSVLIPMRGLLAKDEPESKKEKLVQQVMAQADQQAPQR